MTDKPMDITAIIVSFNTAGLLRDAIGQLQNAAQRMSLKIAIVDNASKDNSVALIRSEFPACTLIVNETNVGFGRANNQALSLIEGRYVLLLNTDAFVSHDTLDKTVTYMDAHPRCGVLGVKLLSRDGSLQPCARYFPTPWNLFLARTGLNRLFTHVRMVDDVTWDHASVRQCDWVPGCYYLVRKELIHQIGLFDPRYFLYYEEVDHCRAAKRAGWEVTFFSDTSVVHIGGESAKTTNKITSNGRQIESMQIESELLYFRKNHGIAGVCANVLLSACGDTINLLKNLLRRRSNASFAVCAQHIAMVWSLFKRTSWGKYPTR
jgi:N-acetylglucosaminyl-diphospho-decaprenol L-rhamnosyltransferase